MKNKLGIILAIISFLGFDATISYAKRSRENVYKEEPITEIRAVYISYLEFYDYFYNGGVSVNKAKINKMLDNLQLNGFNTIFLHVSPFSDSIYESNLFPYSETLTGKEGKNPGFDYLDYFIKVGHMKKMKIHAWINPYRISFSSKVEKISKENPAYQLINTSNIGVDKNGIYYNPASEIVKNLILRQVEEIINKYDVDGIHFDDYFYMQKDVDRVEFEEYKKKKDISLKEFRLMHTNDLIHRVYETIKKKNPNILFSIAPDGNINNNYAYHYADVKTWLSKDGYIDILMPQIYYGFENEYASFIKSLDAWLNLNKINKPIIPVLALYKTGTIDDDAGSGKNEWLNNDNVIMKQINLIRHKNLSGYALFRYKFMDQEKKQNSICVKEMENIKKIN